MTKAEAWIVLAVVAAATLLLVCAALASNEKQKDNKCKYEQAYCLAKAPDGRTVMFPCVKKVCR